MTLQSPSAQDILDHLNADVALDTQLQIQLDQIQELQSMELSLTAENLKALNARRALGSNSLQRGESIHLWEKANHWMGVQIQQGQQQTLNSLQELNRQLTEGSGELRSVPIYSGDMEYLPHEFVEQGLEIWQQKLQQDLHPLLKAFESYLGVVTIHPFDNGNGRTARLSADWELMSHGFLPVCFDSPIQSHVAVTLNQPLRNKNSSFLKFLRGVEQSYSILKKI